MDEAERAEYLAGVDEIWDSEPDLAGRETTMLRWRTTVRRSRGLLPR